MLINIWMQIKIFKFNPRIPIFEKGGRIHHVPHKSKLNFAGSSGVEFLLRVFNNAQIVNRPALHIKQKKLVTRRIIELDDVEQQLAGLSTVRDYNDVFSVLGFNHRKRIASRR